LPPPWWSDPSFSAPGKPVVGVAWGEAGLCAVAVRDCGRALAVSTGPRSLSLRRSRRHERPGARRFRPDSRGPARGPVGGRVRNPERLWPLRRRDDRPRVVPELARARPRPRGARAQGEPRRLMAPSGALVLAEGGVEPSAGVPLLRLRLSGPLGGLTRADAPSS
jgi:hypothetical protein